MENVADTSRQRFYAAVGRVAINWASLELLLDLLVLKGRLQLSGGQDWLKHQLSEKISTVRAQILPRLAGELQGRLASIVNEVDRLSTVRHQLVLAQYLSIVGSAIQTRSSPSSLFFNQETKPGDPLSRQELRSSKTWRRRST